jgi:hypothetical protein
MVSLRPTAGQAMGRGAGRGAILGLTAGINVTVLAMTGLSDRVSVSPWLLGAAPLVLLIVAGAIAGVVFGRDEGADIDEWGIHCVPGATGAAWQDIADLRTVRRGGRTRVSLRLDTGRVGEMRIPYDGRWLAADREFERKLILLSNMFQTHRSYGVVSGLPPGAGGRG